MHTPRGPLRWERAALNATRKPMSYGAKLYRRRVYNASALASAAEMIGESKTMYGFWDPWGKKKYTTCSVYCTAMQIQLDYHVETLEGILEIFEGGNPYATIGKDIRKITAKDLAQDIRCAVCGCTVKKK